MKQLILLSSFLFVFVASSYADRIYIMNSPGYNVAGPEIIAAMQANGHTVTNNTASLGSLPAGFTSRCVDPVNGYDWLCFFGSNDFTALSAQIKAYIDAGGKVFYQYEVTCCTTSALSCATIASNVTGLPVTSNPQDYIGFSGTGGGGWQAVGCCLTIEGDAYKGMDGIPVANQLQATTNIAGSSPSVATCPAYGFFFATTDFTGAADKGGMIGLGDMNAWFDGNEPGNTVNPAVMDYFFPDNSTTCYLFPPGCLETFTSSSGGVTGTISSNAPICAGQTLNLSCTSPTGTTFAWTGPNGFTSNLQNPSIPNAQAVNEGTYSVTISDGGCSVTLTIDITLGGGPTGTIGTNAPICPGQQLELTSSSPTGTSYSWTGPNGFTSNVQNPSIPNAQAVNEGTYTVTISDGSCSSSFTVDVTLSGNVNPVITAGGPYCTNSAAVVLNASIAGGTWSGTGITNAATGAFDPSLAGQGTFTITYTISGGCSGSDTQDFTVNAVPVVTSQDVSTCPYKPVAIQANGATNYVWSPATGLNTTTGNSVIATVGSDITYTIVGTTNGCSATTTAHVTVTTGFVASANASPNPVSAYEPTVEFTAGPIGASFYWVLQDGTVTTDPSFTHTFTGAVENQEIIMVATSPEGCIDTVRFVVYMESDVIFYIPNTFTPDGDEFNQTFTPVFTAGFDPYNFELLVYNRWGELIFETHDASQGWDGTYHGKIVQDGTYTWSLTFKSPESDEKFEYQGHVTKIK